VKQCARLMRSQLNGRDWIEGSGVREKENKIIRGSGQGNFFRISTLSLVETSVCLSGQSPESLKFNLDC
jgi:hypothetical protein